MKLWMSALTFYLVLTIIAAFVSERQTSALEARLAKTEQEMRVRKQNEEHLMDVKTKLAERVFEIEKGDERMDKFLMHNVRLKKLDFPVSLGQWPEEK